MSTILNILSKKMLLAVLAALLALAALPLTGVQAAGLDQGSASPQQYPRLEKLWAREVAIYNRAEAQLARSNEFIKRVQEAIDTANAKGWDTSSVQAALDAFQDAVQDARPILNSANGIVTAHKGFDENGKVTDRAQAIESVKALGQHLKDARAATDGTGTALREAIRLFREAHRPAATP